LDAVRTLVGHDIAVAHALISYQDVSATGEVVRAMLNRLTWVLKPHGGAWKIVHEHTSAPVDGETLKVILQR
jgi:ketosteroid isomerase-like protein